MSTILTITFATFLLLIGVAGLLLPVIPGFLFLLVAAGLYASIFPQVRRTLSRNDRLSQFFQRLDFLSTEKGRQLDMISRCKLAFLASIEAVSPRR